MAWRCSGATNAELIDNLATANIIKSELIKNAFKSVDRGNYAPSNPYQDGPQGIGFQVTISAPHMHAHALENLQNVITKEGSRVLDVGCGSGYLAAVMSRFNPSATIFGIDYIPQLVELSINNTKKGDNDLLLSKKVHFVVGDGWNGLESSGPFDAIHVGAAAAKIPLPLMKQLKIGGRMFIPVGDQGEPQTIVVIDKLKEGMTDDCYKLQSIMGVRFGPLVKQSNKDNVKMGILKPDDILEACFYGDVAAVNILIRNRCNVNIRSAGLDTGLIFAAFYGHLQVVQSLLAYTTYKPLMPQVRYNAAGFATRLVMDKSSGTIKLYCGRNLGLVAIPGSDGCCGPQNGPQCSDCSSLLSSITLQNSAGFPVRSGTKLEGCSTLYCARKLGKDAIPGSDGQCGPNNGPQCSDCCKFQLNEKKHDDILVGIQPISRNELEAVASCQPEVDAVGYEGNTALVSASQRGHAEVMTALIEANCNVNIKNKHGKTALMYASKRGTDAIVKLLLSKASESDLNVADKDGKTSFIHACENGFIDIALMLIKTGKVDSTLKNGEGKTGLDYITASEKKRVVQDCIAAVALKNQPYRFHVDNFVNCDKGHTMSRTSGTPPSYTGVSCDLCKRSKLQEDPFFYNCEPCKFDVCMNCCTSVREKQVSENERKIEELKRQAEEAVALKPNLEESGASPTQRLPLSPEHVVYVEELRRFLMIECDIIEAKAKGLADALVGSDDLTSVKRMKHMHSKGKLESILLKYKPALLSDVDEEIIVDKLNESLSSSSLVSGLSNLSTSGTTAGATSPIKSNIKDIKWSGLEILEVIGKGSYSVVLKARYEIELVAVKVLLCSNGFNNTSTYDELCSSASAEAALISDAERRVINPDSIVHVVGICQGVIPPSISNTFGLSTGAVAVGIVMRYEGGGSLESLLHPSTLTAKRNLNLIEKINILMGIVRGITELHDIDIVHGDIKPGNILLSHHKPPLIRLADFGQSEQRDQSLVDTLGNSVLSQTSTRKGTPVYAAPELLPNLPSDDSDEEDVPATTASSKSTTGVSKITRRSDMYAFALLAWELLNKKGLKPFHTCKDEIALIYKVQKDKRPSIDDLVDDCPSIIRDMIVCCWDRDRNKRLSALDCYTRLEHVYFVLMKADFDIFLSHPWINKNVLQHVKYYLTNAGYRVWYDQEEMGYDLIKSMQDGIMHSKVVLVCLNKAYENSRACMYELIESTKAGKPILTLVTESSPFSWAGDNTSHGNVRNLCQLETKMFIDISSTCNKKGWDECPVPPSLLEELKKGCESLIKFLQDPTINCSPSLSF